MVSKEDINKAALEYNGNTPYDNDYLAFIAGCNFVNNYYRLKEDVLNQKIQSLEVKLGEIIGGVYYGK